MTALRSDSGAAGPQITSLFSSRTAAVALAAIVLCVLSLITGHWLGSLTPTVPTIKLQEVQSMESCTKEIEPALNLGAITNPVERNNAIRDLQLTCYDKSHKQAELNEYQIRRMQFFEQYYEQRIFLWMVVCITVSGVILAGLQLAASYRLSLLGHAALADSKMTIEHKRIVLSSSVVGFFILLLSFAFFYLFITQVFPTKEISMEAGGQRQSTVAPPPFNLKPGKPAAGSNPPSAVQPNAAPTPPAATPPH
jgi:hypothetical protein